MNISEDEPMKQLEINAEKTLENIRGKYPSAAAFARACGGNARRLYFVLSGERGQSSRKSVERQMLQRLMDEDLLVAKDVVNGN